MPSFSTLVIALFVGTFALKLTWLGWLAYRSPEKLDGKMDGPVTGWDRPEC